MHAIFRSKATNQITAMLENATHDVIGDADIQSSVPTACEDVHVVEHNYSVPLVIPEAAEGGFRDDKIKLPRLG